MGAVERALAEGEVRAAEVSFVVHATTVATNAIIEGKIARSGFVTTEGFRDLLEIARQVRPTLYDTRFEKAKPLVPRDRAVGVRERLGPAGEVLVELDDASVREAAALLRREQVESVAVCLLHSYVNPAHEQRIGAILAEELPGRPRLALGRGRPRVPRVPARLDDRHQRRHPAGRRALPRPDRAAARRCGRAGEAARDAVERRRLQLRRCPRPAGLHGRVGAGCGRDRLGVPRGDARPAGHPLLRHGRHDREGRPDPGRPPVGDEGLQRRRPRGRRDRRHVPVGLPGADAGRRPRRDRRRRRLDRLGGLGRAAARRAAERGRRPGAGLLRPRRRGADGHRREPRARAAEPAVLPRRRDRPRPRRCEAGDRGALRGAARALRRRGRERDRRDRERGDGERAPPDLGAARLRPARLRAHRLRRRRARARQRARAGRRDADAADPAQPRHLLRDGAAHHRPQARRRDHDHAPPGRARRRTRRRRRSPSSRPRAATSSCARASASDAIEFQRQVDLRYVGQSYELDDPRRRRAPRALPRGARPDVRLRRPGRAGRGREPAADERRADREAAAAAARPRRRGRAEGPPSGVLRRVGRLRRLPDLRPLRAPRRCGLPGPGRRRGVRLDDRRPPGLPPHRRRHRQPADREGGA